MRGVCDKVCTFTRSFGKNVLAMEESEYLHKLELRGVKPTAIRLLILRTMMDMNRAVSQPDLEERLQTVDKSTIFRTVSPVSYTHLRAHETL